MQWSIVSLLLTLIGTISFAQGQDKADKIAPQKKEYDKVWSGTLPEGTKRRFVLGCHGWWDKDGFNITMVPQGSALTRLRTTPGGGAPDYYLEPRDIIMEIENIPVTTPVAYFLALNTARNWRDVKLRVYDAHQNKQLILYATAIRLLGD